MYSCVEGSVTLYSSISSLGTLILYIFIILYGVPYLAFNSVNIIPEIGLSIICNVNLWLGYIGFSFTYVPIFLRTLEALYIVEYKVKRPMAKKKFVLKTVYLFAILGVYVACVVVYLIIWTANDSTRLE